MTDRELLELAAKAAGYDVRWNPHWECFAHTFPVADKFGRKQFPWIPLDDDGDALRLAVKLRIDLVSNSNMGRECIYAFGHGREGDAQPLDADPYSATRRAIVRAAAAMAPEGL